MIRHLVTQLIALTILLGGPFGFREANAAEPPAESATVFAPTSFWYTPLPADGPPHADSANFVAEFVRQKKAYYSQPLACFVREGTAVANLDSSVLNVGLPFPGASLATRSHAPLVAADSAA